MSTSADFSLFGRSELSNAQAFSGFTPGASDITATSDCTPGPGASPPPSRASSRPSPRTAGTLKPMPWSPAARPSIRRGRVVLNTDTENTTVNELLWNGLIPTIVGTSGNNTITGTTGDDVIHGLGGNDTISGNNGNDVICGGEGNDTLSGNNGIDRLSGENGNDILNGGNGKDVCNGGNGTDTGANCGTVTSIP